MFTKPKITEVDSTTPVITDLNDVFNEINTITNKFLTFPVPLTNSKGNRVSNMFGKVRTINIQGRHYGDGYDEGSAINNIKKFIEEFEAWINVIGTQQRRKYHSIFGLTYLVVCNTFTYQWRETTPVHIEYQIQFIEGGNITTDIVADLFN